MRRWSCDRLSNGTLRGCRAQKPATRLRKGVPGYGGLTNDRRSRQRAEQSIRRVHRFVRALARAMLERYEAGVVVILTAAKGAVTTVTNMVTRSPLVSSIPSPAFAPIQPKSIPV